MKSLIRIESFIALIGLCYIAYYPFINGELENYFLRVNILLPFCIIWVSLCLLSFGSKNFIKLLSSLSVLFRDNLEGFVGVTNFKNAIWLSYVSGITWIAYALVVNPIDNQFGSWQWLFSYCATSLLYAFLLAEFILRPIVFRAESILGKQ